MSENWEMGRLDDELATQSKLTPSLNRGLTAYGGDIYRMLRAFLYKSGEILPVGERNDDCESYNLFRGSRLDPGVSDDIPETDTMIVGSYPPSRALVSSDNGTSQVSWMLDFVRSYHPEDLRSWYFTFLVKYKKKAAKSQVITAADLANCRPLFEQELRLTGAKFLIVLGKYTAEALLRKKVIVNLTGFRFHDMEYVFEDGKTQQLKVLVCPSIVDMTLSRDAEKARRFFDSQIQFFLKHTKIEDGHRVLDESAGSQEKRYVFTSDPEILEMEVDRVMSLAEDDPKRRIIALDLEWEGKYPEQEGAHVLTVQFSSAPHESTVVILDSHALKKNPLSAVDRKKLIKQLNRLLTHHDNWRPRVGGHFLRADLPWLLTLGIDGKGYAGHDILWSYQPPKGLEFVRDEGGWDTSLMYHAYSEKAVSYGLKELCSAELGIPVWSTELEDFKEAWKKETGLKDLSGYGVIPDEILHPYAAMDADGTRQLAELCMFGMDGRPALLDCDVFGNESWAPYWYAHRAAAGFLDIEMTGLCLNTERYQALCDRMTKCADTLLDSFRERINWPDFNPDSVDHKRAFLFGPEFASRDGKKFVMPDGAMSLRLNPVYDSVTKTRWDDMDFVSDEFDDDGTSISEVGIGFSASTDKNVMNLLGRRNPLAKMLNDICKLRHTLRSVLSRKVDVWDEKGHHELYPKGHYKFIRNDMRVHAKLSQMKATGRASCSQPNLQNIGKGSESVLKGILGYVDESTGEAKGTYLDLFGGPQYLYGIRTMYGPAPGYFFAEPDLTGAELAAGAWVSGDPTMIEHVRRNALPEDDPMYRDMHTEMAIRAFNLDLGDHPRTKKGLAAIGKADLRGAAKAVEFGVMYGRGAASIQLQCETEGLKISLEEAHTLVNTFLDMYPFLAVYLRDMSNAVNMFPNGGYVTNLFGRYRRFVKDRNTPQDLLAKMGREFCNAPVQGTVADAMNVVIYNLLKARHETGLDFKIAMQIHDALLLMIKFEDGPRVLNELIPNAMVRDNPITVGDKQYHFAIDTDLYLQWGQKLTDKLCLEHFGKPLSFLKGE